MKKVRKRAAHRAIDWEEFAERNDSQTWFSATFVLTDDCGRKMTSIYFYVKGVRGGRWLHLTPWLFRRYVRLMAST